MMKGQSINCLNFLLLLFIFDHPALCSRSILEYPIHCTWRTSLLFVRSTCMERRCWRNELFRENCLLLLIRTQVDRPNKSNETYSEMV